ncbi:MAG TPA: TlyA family RNA methyltransferase [bacterium]|nr:TlyA family RNA methyltransferase [bacterium]
MAPPPRGVSPTRERLDVLLVERGLLPSREQARAAVMAGEVRVDGRAVDTPGARISSAATLTLERRRPLYVSRGGIKLSHALATFRISSEGLIALDVGSSTGGFTDALLQAGAARVYAVDIGTGQLHWRLRRDPRVMVRERTHAARLTDAEVPELIDLATVDVSFISLTRVLPAVAARLRSDGTILALVKPQFEAGRARVRGGVVRSAEVHRDVLRRLAAWVGDHGWRVAGLTASPLAGPKGNREFFLWIRLTPPAPGRSGEIEAMIEAALAEAHG